MNDAHPSPAGDCTFVIFGATGDLARRKLLPALTILAGRQALPDRFAVLAVGRTPVGSAKALESALSGVKPGETVMLRLGGRGGPRFVTLKAGG